jgi:hypothetical protein
VGEGESGLQEGSIRDSKKEFSPRERKDLHRRGQKDKNKFLNGSVRSAEKAILLLPELALRQSSARFERLAIASAHGKNAPNIGRELG